MRGNLAPLSFGELLFLQRSQLTLSSFSSPEWLGILVHSLQSAVAAAHRARVSDGQTGDVWKGS